MAYIGEHTSATLKIVGLTECQSGGRIAEQTDSLSLRGSTGRLAPSVLACWTASPLVSLREETQTEGIINTCTSFSYEPPAMYIKGSAAPMCNVIITSDAISLQVNPLQCGYFCQLVGEDGKVVISQIDAAQMLHAAHTVRQFGKNVSLQIQFCKDVEGFFFFPSTPCDFKHSIFSQNVLLKKKIFPTSEFREDGKEFAREDLHLVVSQSDVMDVVRNTVQYLEDAVWEGNKLAVGQICRGMSIYIIIQTTATTQCS